MGATGLTFHVPVGLFLRRIFNVASSLTITNYYFLYRKNGDGREKEADALLVASSRRALKPVMARYTSRTGTR